MLSEDGLEVYKDQQWSRSLQWLLESMHSNTVSTNFLHSGPNIYYHYKFLTHNELIEFTAETVA